MPLYEIYYTEYTKCWAYVEAKDEDEARLKFLKSNKPQEDFYVEKEVDESQVWEITKIDEEKE